LVDDAPFEFLRDEVRYLRDMASSVVVPEQEIRGVYLRFIERAAASGKKPDSSFMLAFIRRPSFVRKSSYREKLLTLLSALQCSIAWSVDLHRKPRGSLQSLAK
jgi:hypothetical protein